MSTPARRRLPPAVARQRRRAVFTHLSRVGLVVLAAALSIATSAAALWFALTWTIVRTPDGEILLLQKKQAEECASGGPCAVFSAREFVRDATTLCRQAPR